MMTSLKNTGGVAVLVISYLALIRFFRYRREKSVLRSYARRSLASMTLEEASSIQCNLAQLEFPLVFSASLFFALFKTYSIPSISKLLVSTRELSDATTASKRTADTGVLLTEVVFNPIVSERALDGIARMNFLHGRYRKAGKISNDDMLYTLSLFALEPIRWVKRYEWRCLTNVERCALGVFWKDMGEVMDIPFGQLKPFLSLHGPEEDGLSWLEALELWSVAYESKQMRPAKSNHTLAVATLDIASFNVPGPLKRVFLGLAGALLEPRLRRAMRLPEPKQAHLCLLWVLFALRRLVVRHLCFPKPPWMKMRWFTDRPDPATGRYHALRYVAHPWYVEPNISSRWGPIALCLRALGGLVPGHAAIKYLPEGYLIPELGPVDMNGKGEAEMANDRQRIRERRRPAGCPW